MNVSVKNFQIVPFPGFYQGIYDINENLCRHFEDEADYFGLNGWEDFEEDRDYTFDYDGYKKSVAEGWVKCMQSLLFNYLEIDCELTNFEVDSPRYYNYSTDKIYCEFRCKNFKKIMKKILTLMDKHKDELDDIIQSNHTSYDGFLSFMDNRFYKWREYLSNPKNYTDNQFSLYFTYIVTYLLMIEMDTDDSIEKQADYLYWKFINFAEDYDDLYEFISYTDSFYERTKESRSCW